VDKRRLTQFGRAMSQLGIHMIAAYSPEARGRSERFFSTLQGRLPKELALAKITTIKAANEFLQRGYLKRFNRRFMVTPAESGSAFVPLMGVDIDNILCRQVERRVSKDSCVTYQGIVLALPNGARFRHYFQKMVRVHEYPDGHLAIFHGPRCLPPCLPPCLPAGRQGRQASTIGDCGAERQPGAAH